jgi:hypothetical protein
MAIHTFGEYLDFHAHLHALVVDGLFVRESLFHVLPEVSLKPVEELFRARIITFLVDKGLLSTIKPGGCPHKPRLAFIRKPTLHNTTSEQKRK